MVNYQKQNQVDIRIVRIFNTYGPRMALNDGRVVSNFILQALRHEPITIFGRGEQTRSFCYVSDLIEGTVRMMEQEAISGPLNLGNPEEITVLELAELVLRLTASRSRIVFKELPVDDPVRRRPDIALARETLGWEIKVPLADGLRATIDYFRNVLSA
jgi:UDP-glucuronate decarboxylase